MDLLSLYALSFLGTPYKYGGNNPMDGGMDCSGFVSEVLRAAGSIGWNEDLTAQQIYNRVEASGRAGVVQSKSLAFFGESVTKITHVGFCLDPYVMIEAGGGGKTTDTLPDAANNNAMIRLRPIKYRKDFLVAIKPDYSKIGYLP